jgi:hypothetical protein
MWDRPRPSSHENVPLLLLKTAFLSGLCERWASVWDGRPRPSAKTSTQLRGIYETTVQLDRETVPKGQQDSAQGFNPGNTYNHTEPP